MSVPNPATTDWVPLGGSTVDLRYLGAWAAGSYVDGDVVMGSDNIAYLCVRPTTNAPVSWSGISGPVGPPGPQGPQGPAGIQGPAGAGIPTVQNGKWLNGSGGAAVWASIAQTDLPGNIAGSAQDSSTAMVAPGKDLNNATKNGWYIASQDSDQWGPTINRPPTPYACVLMQTYRQIAYAYGSLAIFQRQVQGSTWFSWVQTQWHPTGWVNATAFLNGWHNYGDPYPYARVQQIASGMVIMSGLLSGGSSGDAFTLPAPPAGIGAQFIPNLYRHMGGWSVDLIGSVRVQPNGNVSLTSSALQYFTLDNVVYWPY